MNTSTDRTKLRNILLDNGYRPLPLTGKRILIKGWTRDEIDADWLKKHNRSAKSDNTGIRCDNLAAFDIDVYDEDLALECEQIVEEICGNSKLCRFGEYPKRLLLYAMVDEPAGNEMMKSKRTGKYGGHMVELLTSPGRQFAAFGIHPKINEPYDWDSATPLDTPWDDLPRVDPEIAQRCMDELERHLENTGLEKQSRASSIDRSDAKIEDLQDDTPFELNGVQLPWSEIKGLITQTGLWCNMMRENGQFGDSRGVHVYTAEGTGRPCAHDFPRDVTHFEAVMPSDYGDQLPDEPGSTNMFDSECMAELVNNYVLLGDKTVRHIDHPEDFYTFDGFKLLKAHWEVPAPTARMPMRTEPAVVAWSKEDRTLRADKASLRPDHPDDAMVRDGQQTIFNTYNPPMHPGEGGELHTLFEFLEHLLPNPLDRNILLDWLALKVVNPGWRMHGIVMVTKAYGTGRGTLSQILQKLFGIYYVNEIPLGQLIGRGGQSDFNEYLADSLIVTVPEALEEREEQTKWQSRRMAYEQLKLVCDPVSQRSQVRRKYGKNSIEWIYASLLISSNHTDALAMDKNDRRLIVLANGDTPLPDAPNDLYNRIHQWKLDPLNIGALYRCLKLRTRTVEYDPFGMPPMTPAKQSMVDQSRSDMDVLYERFVADCSGDLVTHAQWRMYAYKQKLSLDLHLPQGDSFDSAITVLLAQNGSRLTHLPSSGIKIDKQVVRPWVIRNPKKWIECDRRDLMRKELRKNGDLGGKVVQI